MLANIEAIHQSPGSGLPMRKTEKSATSTTLVPSSGVATEISPVEMARKVKTCPRKKRLLAVWSG
jgi:hypothetical protein